MYKVTVRTPEGRFVGFKEFNSYFKASEYYREKSKEGFFCMLHLAADEC